MVSALSIYYIYYLSAVGNSCFTLVIKFNTGFAEVSRISEKFSLGKKAVLTPLYFFVDLLLSIKNY